jgi:hypothetical protein
MEYLEIFKGESFRKVCFTYFPDIPAPTRPVKPAPVD